MRARGTQCDRDQAHPTDGKPLPTDAWQFGQDVVAPDGHTILTGAQFDQVQHAAAALRPNPAAQSDYLQELNQWLHAHGYTQVLTYPPAGRFWAFQGIEAAICLILALAAIAVAHRLVLRHLA
jgi:hypothetical protein